MFDEKPQKKHYYLCELMNNEIGVLINTLHFPQAVTSKKKFFFFIILMTPLSYNYLDEDICNISIRKIIY